MKSFFNNSVYTITFLTTLIFITGFLYEYAYLEAFGLKEHILLLSSSQVLINGFYVILRVSLDNSYFLAGIALTVAAVFVVKSLPKEYLKIRFLVEEYLHPFVKDPFVKVNLIYWSVALLLITPVLAGVKQAKKDSTYVKSILSQEVYQKIILTNGDSLKGYIIRVLDDEVIVLEQRDKEKITHLYPKSEIKDMQVFSIPEQSSVQSSNIVIDNTIDACFRLADWQLDVSTKPVVLKAVIEESDKASACPCKSALVQYQVTQEF